MVTKISRNEANFQSSIWHTLICMLRPLSPIGRLKMFGKFKIEREKSLVIDIVVMTQAHQKGAPPACGRLYHQGGLSGLNGLFNKALAIEKARLLIDRG